MRRSRRWRRLRIGWMDDRAIRHAFGSPAVLFKNAVGSRQKAVARTRFTAYCLLPSAYWFSRIRGFAPHPHAFLRKQEWGDLWGPAGSALPREIAERFPGFSPGNAAHFTGRSKACGASPDCSGFAVIENVKQPHARRTRTYSCVSLPEYRGERQG